jgi:hypothetical protein
LIGKPRLGYYKADVQGNNGSSGISLKKHMSIFFHRIEN